MTFVLEKKEDIFREIVVYDKQRKEKGVIIMSLPIVGIPLLINSTVLPKHLIPLKDQPDFVYEAMGDSKFSSIKKKIPPSFIRRKQINKKWFFNAFMQPYISPETITSLKTNGGYELHDWIEAHKSSWITIADIVDLPINKKVKILMLDRNIYDNKDRFKKAKLYAPKTFFSKDYMYFTKTNEDMLSGSKKYLWSDTAFENEEFDIEYKPGYWFPLKDGFLPAKDDQKFVKLLGKKRHWKEFSTATHIGLRGPMMFWDDAKNLNPVFFL